MNEIGNAKSSKAVLPELLDVYNSKLDTGFSTVSSIFGKLELISPVKVNADVSEKPKDPANALEFFSLQNDRLSTLVNRLDDILKYLNVII